MEKEKDTMKLEEHIAVFRRAVKMLFLLNRSGAACIILNEFFDAILPYIPVYFSAKIIDVLCAGGAGRLLARYAVLAVGLSFLVNLLLTRVKIVRDIKWEAIYREEEWAYSRKEMNLEYACTESRDIALLVSRIRMESQTGYNLYYLYNCVGSLVRHITSITASVSLLFSFFLLPSIPVYAKLGMVAGILFTLLLKIYTTSKEEKITEEFFAGCVDLNVLGEKYGSFFGNYNMGMDARLYAMEEKICGGQKKVDEEFYAGCVKKDTKRVLLSIPGVVLNDLLKFAAYLILIAGSIAGAVSVGSIAKYVACIMFFMDAAAGLFATLRRAESNNYYLRRFFSYFDIPNNMYQGSLTVEKRLDNEYYVEFKDVSFRYPNTENYALRHVNVKFKVGEKLAVVGVNGSGKTTFIKLLCRLYDPTEGEILLNGVNIRKYDYDEYMSIFSVVFQDFQLFSFTLGQNVAAAKEYDEGRVIECLNRAGFGERLKTMPAGTKTYLYQDYAKEGVEISGGEAQKIALARALYKDAPFIVLDEPTAALDPVSEYEVYSKFNELSGERTAIYISHRLASCRFCDSIMVFDEGSIIQYGSHEALVADTNGRYYELWNAQAQYYVSGDRVSPDRKGAQGMQ